MIKKKMGWKERNGRVIRGNSKILIKDFLIERKLGIRVVYLNFEGVRFGWGSLACLPMV
jgi:hypothetical protein